MIVTQLDAAYSPWLDLFLASLRLTNPAVHVCVELVNFHPLLAQHFEQKYPTTSFSHVSLEGATRTVLAHRKVDAALACSAKYPHQPWYLVCDVDLLFRGSLEPLIAELAPRQAGIVFREGFWEGSYYEHLRVACGFVAFKDTALLTMWKSEMEKPTCLGYEAGSWFYDQITLVSATRSLPMDYLSIDDRTYLNREFSPDALVWSANMEPKELMYLKFVEELDRLKAKAVEPPPCYPDR